MKKIGIIQGRLTPPEEGFQICPKNWREEFSTLKILGLTHIEWIVTTNKYLNNPFFTEDISRFPVSSVCLDNVVDERISKSNFIEENIIPACERVLKLGWKSITIPLLENSSIEDDVKYVEFYKSFSDVTKTYRDINFCLETELSISKLVKLCSIGDNIKVTYDTGNTTSYGISHLEYINEMFSKIENIHLKDRTFNAQTKEPGMGNTPFLEIFSILKNKNYEKFYTLQTARCTSGEELNTIRRHSEVLRRIYDTA